MEHSALERTCCIKLNPMENVKFRRVCRSIGEIEVDNIDKISNKLKK